MFRIRLAIHARDDAEYEPKDHAGKRSFDRKEFSESIRAEDDTFQLWTTEDLVRNCTQILSLEHFSQLAQPFAGNPSFNSQ